MARKAGKEYQPDDIRTATFKLPHHKWEAFQAICKGQDRSASDVLLEFVETILNGGDIPTTGNEEMGRFKEEMNAAIAAINARLDALGTAKATKPRKPKPKPVQAEIIEVESVSESEPLPVSEKVNKSEQTKDFSHLPFFGLEDGGVYSQLELAERFSYPGRSKLGSISVRKWIKEGQHCQDDLIRPIIPHLTFSHTDGEKQPNFYRFTLNPSKKIDG